MSVYKEDWAKLDDYGDARDHLHITKLSNLVQQMNQQTVTESEPEIKSVIKDLSIELKRAKALYNELSRQKKLVDDPLTFLYMCDEDLDEMRDWCFENNLVCKIIFLSISDYDVQAMVFKSKEDAMAFKLQWT